jgi:hypothetical protein
VIEEHDLRRSESTVGNNKFPENIFCYRGSAGSDNVDIGLRQTPRFQGGLRDEDPCRLQLRFWGWMRPQLSIVLLGIRLVCFQRFVDNTHCKSPLLASVGWPEEPPMRVQPPSPFLSSANGPVEILSPCTIISERPHRNCQK